MRLLCLLIPILLTACGGPASFPVQSHEPVSMASSTGQSAKVQPFVGPPSPFKPKKTAQQESKSKSQSAPRKRYDIDDRYGFGKLGPRVLLHDVEISAVEPRRIALILESVESDETEEKNERGNSLFKKPRIVRIYRMADVRTSKRPGFALRESSDVPNKDLTLQLIPPPPKPLDSSGNVFRPWIPRRASLPLREWVDIIVDAGHAYGLDPVFIAAMIKAESNFDHKAVSHAGARGAMQIMPGTQKQLGLSEPFDARANVYAGCKFIRSLLLKFNSTELALAAYNAGPFAVKKAHGIPPFKETQHYVRRVMRLWQGI